MAAGGRVHCARPEPGGQQQGDVVKVHRPRPLPPRARPLVAGGSSDRRTVEWRRRTSRLGGRVATTVAPRNVRTPQGRVVVNGNPGRPAGQCHREQTAAPHRGRGKGETVG